MIEEIVLSQAFITVVAGVLVYSIKSFPIFRTMESAPRA